MSTRLTLLRKQLGGWLICYGVVGMLLGCSADGGAGSDNQTNSDNFTWLLPVEDLLVDPLHPDYDPFELLDSEGAVSRSLVPQSSRPQR